MRSVVATVAALAATVAVSSGPRAHLGGEVIRPVFLSPAPTMLTVNEPLTIAWNDPDEDPTGVLHFYMVQGRNVPPIAEPDADLLGGTEVASVAVSDTTDALTVDMSVLPPGAYTLYAVTRDPPLCEQVTPLHAMLRVTGSEEPAMPAMMALWRKPSDPLTTVSGVYPLRLAVASVSQPTFTLEVGRMVGKVGGDPSDPCSGRQSFEPDATLVTDELATPDNEGGANLWIARYVWTEPMNLEAGTYIVRATVTNAENDVLTLYSPGEIQILAPEPADAPESGPETGPDADATAEVPDIDTPPEGCAGSLAGHGGGAAVIVGLLLAWRRRERYVRC